jgi:hypothetical protein
VCVPECQVSRNAWIDSKTHRHWHCLHNNGRSVPLLYITQRNYAVVDFLLPVATVKTKYFSCKRWKVAALLLKHRRKSDKHFLVLLWRKKSGTNCKLFVLIAEHGQLSDNFIKIPNKIPEYTKNMYMWSGDRRR